MGYNSKYTGAEVDAALDLAKQVPNKQDVISDLDSIRSGAAKGATALQGMPSSIEVTGKIATASVVRATARMRVNSAAHNTVFGYFDVKPYGTTNNVGCVRIGGCYGGNYDDLNMTESTEGGVGMTCINTYRGKVGIGKFYTDTELRALHDASCSLGVYQNLSVGGTVSQGSDIRYKDVIEDKELNVEDIANAPLFSFKWNDREDEHMYIGTSAQYWENIMQEAVRGTEDFKNLDYATLGTAIGISLARVILQQSKKIELLESKIKELTK